MSETSTPTHSDGSDGHRKGSFLPNHPPVRRGVSRMSRHHRLFKVCKELQDRHNLPFSDPLEMLLHIVCTGHDPLENKMDAELGDKSPFREGNRTWTREDGSVAIRGFIPLETRIDCARLAMAYMYPKLTSIELSGEDGKPVFGEDAALARQLSVDPDVRRLMEKISAKAANDGEATEAPTELVQ